MNIRGKEQKTTELCLNALRTRFRFSLSSLVFTRSGMWFFFFSSTVVLGYRRADERRITGSHYCHLLDSSGMTETLHLEKYSTFIILKSSRDEVMGMHHVIVSKCSSACRDVLRENVVQPASGHLKGFFYVKSLQKRLDGSYKPEELKTVSIKTISQKESENFWP